jgi:hypothetical protein
MNTKVTVSRVPQVITVNTAGGSSRLSGLSDVNMNGASDGAVLQYDAATQSWIAENVLEKSGLQINCGNF